MNKSIETQAKTIEAAIDEALLKLGASYEEVEVDIIQEAGFLKKAKVRVTLKSTETSTPIKEVKPISVIPSAAEGSLQPTDKSKEEKSKHEKQKPAKLEKKAVKIEIKTETKSTEELPKKFQTTLDFTKKFLTLLENTAEVTYEITDKSFNINVIAGSEAGNGVGQIIGKGGEVLNAIQTIISSIAIANSNGENKRVYFNVEDYKERRVETLKALAVRKAEKVKETGRYIKLEPMNARERAIIHSALQEIEGVRTFSQGKEPHRCLCIAPARE